MKKTVLILVLTALLGTVTTPAHADYNDGDRVPQHIIAPLMAWVEAQTGVRVPVMPQVIASHDKLMAVVGRMGRIQGRARAVFVGGGVIVDSNSFDPEDVTQMSLLVHELVHYAQLMRRGGVWGCAQEKEVEAYTLQNKWLEEQGSSPYVNASWIARVSSCPTTSAVALAQN